MKFRLLQENLRKALWDRIEKGELTGLGLAEQTGFKQGHISNFLNRKRGLSLEGMDKVLNVQRISVLDLLDPAEINRRATILPPSPDDFEDVLLIDGSIAAEPLIQSMNVQEILKFRRTFLHRLRPQSAGPRLRWERFVALRIDAREGMSMYPRLLPGATVLIDRHYNSLKTYRKRDRNMYAVFRRGHSTIKYVEVSGRNLLLRPHNQSYPVELIAIDRGKSPSDYLIGRVCQVSIET